MAVRVEVVTDLLPATGVGATLDLRFAGFGNPQLVEFYAARAGTNNPQPSLGACIGFWTATDSRAASVHSVDGSAAASSSRKLDTALVYNDVLPSGTASLSASCALSPLGDGVRLTITADTTSAQRRIYAVMYSGLTNFKVGTIILSGTTVPVTDIGFKADVGHFMTVGTAGTALASNAVYGFGMFRNSAANVVSQGSIQYFSDTGEDPMWTGSGISADSCIARIFDDIYNWRYAASAVNSTGFTLTGTADGGGVHIYYAVMQFPQPDDAWVGLINTQTALGTHQTTGIPHQPQFLGLAVSGGVTSNTPAQNGFFGIGLASSTVQGSMQHCDQDGPNTANADSYSDTANVLHVRNDQGATDAIAAKQSFNADGFTLNYTDAATSARPVLAWTFGDSSATATPISFGGTVPPQIGFVGVPFELDLSGYFSGTEGPFEALLETGVWPAGLELDEETFVVSGTPTTPELRTGISITGIDADAAEATSNPFAIRITAAELDVTSERTCAHPDSYIDIDPADNALEINLIVRTQITDSMGVTPKWLEFNLRLMGVMGERPRVRIPNYSSTGPNHQNWASTQRPHYSKDLGATWIPYSDCTVGTSELSFQDDAAFDVDEVWICRSWSRSLTQIGTDLVALAAQYPTMITTPPVGAAFTPTVSLPGPQFICSEVKAEVDELGRVVPVTPIYFCRIDDQAYGPKPYRILIIAGGHAGEDVGELMAWAKFHWFLSSASDAVYLRSICTIDFVPCWNPNGRFGGHWRGSFDSVKDPNREMSLTSGWTQDCANKIRAMLMAEYPAGSLHVGFDFHASPSESTVLLGSWFDAYPETSAFANEMLARLTTRGLTMGNYLDVGGTVNWADSDTMYGFIHRDLGAVPFLFETCDRLQPLSPTVMAGYAHSSGEALAKRMLAGDYGDSYSSDAILLSDVATFERIRSVVVSESQVLTDVSVSIQAAANSAIESLVMGQSSSTDQSALSTVTDGVILSETITNLGTFSVTSNQSVTVADTGVSSVSATTSAQDSVAPDDSSVTNSAVPLAATQSLMMTDNATYAGIITTIGTDGALISELVTVTGVALSLSNDLLGFTDSALTGAVASIVAQQNLILGEQAAAVGAIGGGESSEERTYVVTAHNRTYIVITKGRTYVVNLSH